MALIKNIKIKNLRSLKNVDSAPISPITILVGKNSIGKSTFARIFPLIKQSIEAKKKSPILWFGDYVDFGSLEQAVTRGEKDIFLSFDIEVRNEEEVRNIPYNGHYFYGDFLQLFISRIKVDITLSSSFGSVYTKKLTLSIADICIDIVFTDLNEVGSIYFNKEKVILSGDEKVRVVSKQGNILPLVIYIDDHKNSKHFYGLIPPLVKEEELKPAAVKALHKYWLAGVDAIADALTKSRVKIPLHFKDKFDYARHIQRTQAINSIPFLINAADEVMSDYFSSVSYLKPLRATAQRYYRRQELSVHEIDSEGRNFPMFLDSLNSDSLQRFQRWLNSELNIRVEAKREGEQIMVMASNEDDNDYYNIADMGFGISQVLPIAAQLWMTNEKQKKSSVVVIEQPELHLHPEYQSRLANVFSAFINLSRNSEQGNKSLIIETHSPHIINRLGELIELKKLRPDDVTVLLFEPSSDQSELTKIRVSSFDEDGMLKNWPFGFFEPGFNNAN